MERKIRLQIFIADWKKKTIKSRAYELGFKSMGDYIWHLVKHDVPLDDLAAIKLRESVE